MQRIAVTESADDVNEPFRSPCIRICCLDDQDICLGCYRSLADILNWQNASNEEKQRILELCKLRKAERSAQ